MKERKELKDLTLMDRFLFAEAADDPEFMEILLSIIFGGEIHLKYPPQTEKEARSTSSGKQIRLDVWAMDREGAVYDAEPQQQNTYNLPKRSRYYQSLIDHTLLEPGDIDYNNLNDVYLIIITSFDLFGKGLYQYTFRMSCMEASGLELADGAVRIFLNTRGTDPQGISPELMALLRYFEETTDKAAQESGSLRIQTLHQKVTAIKSSEDMGVKYMQAWEERVLDRQEGFHEGHNEGKAVGKFEALGALVADGLLSLDQADDRMDDKKEEFIKWYEGGLKNMDEQP